jgi:hypothetical protein
MIVDVVVLMCENCSFLLKIVSIFEILKIRSERVFDGFLWRIQNIQTEHQEILPLMEAQLDAVERVLVKHCYAKVPVLHLIYFE